MFGLDVDTITGILLGICVILAIFAWICFDAAKYMDEQELKQEVEDFNAEQRETEDGYRLVQHIIDGEVVTMRYYNPVPPADLLRRR